MGRIGVGHFFYREYDQGEKFEERRTLNGGIVLF
jgi:hypothetical protein